MTTPVNKDTIAKIVSLQRERCRIIEMNNINTLMVTSYMVRTIIPPEAGNKIKLRQAYSIAGNIFNTYIENCRRNVKEKELLTYSLEDEDIMRQNQGYLELVAFMLVPLRERLATVHNQMDELAESLPSSVFVNSIPGLKNRALAIIIGEARNLSDYPTLRHFWRRFGLGTEPEHQAYAYSTWARKDWRPHELTKKEWEEAGYNPRRLAQLIGVVGDCLIKNKKKSKYGEIYDNRRLYTMKTHPEWWFKEDGTPISRNAKTGEPASGHGAKDAMRIMVKAFLKDLYFYWKAQHGINNFNPNLYKSVEEHQNDARQLPASLVG